MAEHARSVLICACSKKFIVALVQSENMSWYCHCTAEEFSNLLDCSLTILMSSSIHVYFPIPRTLPRGKHPCCNKFMQCDHTSAINQAVAPMCSMAIFVKFDSLHGSSGPVESVLVDLLVDRLPCPASSLPIHRRLLHRKSLSRKVDLKIEEASHLPLPVMQPYREI